MLASQFSHVNQGVLTEPMHAVASRSFFVRNLDTTSTAFSGEGGNTCLIREVVVCVRLLSFQVCERLEFSGYSVYKIGKAILGDVALSILTMYTKLENCIKIPCAANCCCPNAPTKDSPRSIIRWPSWSRLKKDPLVEARHVTHPLERFLLQSPTIQYTASAFRAQLT